jgi:two-component system phosphate regulon sensor histidine kinase PhoR
MAGFRRTDGGFHRSKVPHFSDQNHVRILTENVLQQLKAKWASDGHQLKTGYDVPRFMADPSRVEQVLVNLIENAFKYVPQGKTIRVLWEKDPEDGVVLRVADDGPGIPLEHQRWFFERFYRMDKARSRETGGTGLGLSIVKHIMQRHGGTVELKSEPGHGAEFICRFPQD